MVQNTKPRWIDFGSTWASLASMKPTCNVTGSSFTLDFSGTNYVPTVTMMAHAPKGELNYSNNPTFKSCFRSFGVVPV